MTLFNATDTFRAVLKQYRDVVPVKQTVKLCFIGLSFFPRSVTVICLDGILTHRYTCMYTVRVVWGRCQRLCIPVWRHFSHITFSLLFVTEIKVMVTKKSSQAVIIFADLSDQNLTERYSWAHIQTNLTDRVSRWLLVCMPFHKTYYAYNFC